MGIAFGRMSGQMGQERLRATGDWRHKVGWGQEEKEGGGGGGRGDSEGLIAVVGLKNTGVEEVALSVGVLVILLLMWVWVSVCW